MGGWHGEGGEVVAVGETVDGFIALGPIPGCRGAASCRPPRSWPLGRRSGRVPALPYPPPRLLQCIRDHGHLAIPGWVARSQDGAEGFAWDRGLDQEDVQGSLPTGGLSPWCGVRRIAFEHLKSYLLIRRNCPGIADLRPPCCHLSRSFAPAFERPGIRGARTRCRCSPIRPSAVHLGHDTIGR